MRGWPEIVIPAFRKGIANKQILGGKAI